MAGSRTFLQPILADTVQGIDSSIQSMNEKLGEVKSSIDPVPSKIDDQIVELGKVIDAIGSTAQGVKIKKSYENNLTNIVTGINKTLSYTSLVKNAVVDLVTYTKTIFSNCSGTYGLKIDASDIHLSMLLRSAMEYNQTNFALRVKIYFNETGGAETLIDTVTLKSYSTTSHSGINIDDIIGIIIESAYLTLATDTSYTLKIVFDMTNTANATGDATNLSIYSESDLIIGGFDPVNIAVEPIVIQ